jgi:SAM-dependent methyltransferase
LSGGSARVYVSRVSFNVSDDAYGRFMGRFSRPLSSLFADWAGIRPGHTALDVGCGPGALTAVLIDRLGASSVAAIDPSEPFVDAARRRFPDADVRLGSAEALPFADDSFDFVLAQLVVQFMADPVAGVTEMARVTHPDGLIAACVWDHAGDRGPLSLFWRAARDLNPDAPDESTLTGTAEGDLGALFDKVGLHDIESTTLTAHVAFPTFDDWWEPYTFGVGPAGAYVASLDDQQRAELAAHCAELLPPAPFEIDAMAWAAAGRT